MKLRIKFRKFGVMKFIGHLDIMRFFQKVIRRAGIDAAYTQGFSPHQIMSFAAPLGVGLESNGEYMDIEVHSTTDSRDMTDRLNRASVDGIEIISVKRLPEDAGNAMACVAAASYTVTFRKGMEPEFDFLNGLAEFLNQPSIPFEKKTKRSSLVIDLKPAIYELKALEHGIFMIVNASSSGNIKPAMVMEAYLAYNAEGLKENALSIVREDTFLNTGTQEHPVFAPMDAIGEPI